MIFRTTTPRSSASCLRIAYANDIGMKERKNDQRYRTGTVPVGRNCLIEHEDGDRHDPERHADDDDSEFLPLRLLRHEVGSDEYGEAHDDVAEPVENRESVEDADEAAQTAPVPPEYRHSARTKVESERTAGGR